MIRSQHFWVNGHHGHIECKGRANYEATIDGEKFDTSISPKSMKEEMKIEMRYREESQPDLAMVCHGLIEFLSNNIPGVNERTEWVLLDAVNEEIIIDDTNLAFDAAFSCEEAGYVEIVEVYTSPSTEFLLRPNVDSVPEPEELRGNLPGPFLSNAVQPEEPKD